MRDLNFLDHLLNNVDLAIRTMVPPENRASKRSFPGEQLVDEPLDIAQKKHVAGLMRVNHAGEVCAQALYQGQALTAKLTTIKQQMMDAAEEENDHLAWCEQRLRDLDSYTSRLNPFWYFGSLMIGSVAGLLGDRVSLGFVAETEQQVSAHLQNHLKNLPPQDKKTRVILEQMQEDESHHALVAKDAGGVALPIFIRKLMTGVSKLMTKTSYYF
ncbi:MAG: 2-polyprenyl-3-methyl-6-methoxy-1,4-benzoquinone monooxygenase [Legionella sp.]|nr:2-polyprenyl-3-methyl-6-methoxy-1,4-benzoquinone monooxygenase [Legionella sp.]